MRIAAIVNPVAGRRKAGRKWPLLLQSVGSLAGEVDTFWSRYPGHCVSLAASARRAGYDRVIAVGGDGTLNEVLNGLWWEEKGRMPSLGMVPFGTACEYVRNFEIGRGMSGRFQTAVGESAARVSLGLCRYRVGDRLEQRVFAMVLGLGFDAEVVHNFNRLGFTRSCWLSYAIGALVAMRNMRPFSLEGAVDGFRFQVDTLFFGALLGQSIAEGMKIAPRASPSSDRLEFVRVSPVSPAGLLLEILRAYLVGINNNTRTTTRLPGRRAEIGSRRPVRFEADGELLGMTSAVAIELIPEAFSFAARKVKSRSPNSNEKVMVL
ncbi:MAG: diacylglycerol kinase family protein [Syntrophobacteraceae bacterium]|nr:diacylglycerol kinase family protein [Syntrophobacteraceae bacterium]